jgi:hypothetical protein
VQHVLRSHSVAGQWTVVLYMYRSLQGNQRSITAAWHYRQDSLSIGHWPSHTRPKD